MNEIVERFLAQRKHDHVATLDRRRRWLRSLSDFCEQRGLDWQKISPENIQQYQEHLTWSPGPWGRVPSANTIYQAMSMLRTFLRWAFAQGLLGEQDPTSNWMLGPTPNTEKKLLSRRQLEIILQESIGIHPLGLRNRALLNIFAEMGLYAQVCHRLNLADVDLVRYRLASVAMGPTVAEHLQRYLKHGRPALLTDPDEPALFLSRFGARTPRATLVTLPRKMAGSGVNGRTLHRSWLAHREAFLGRRLTDS